MRGKRGHQTKRPRLNKVDRNDRELLYLTLWTTSGSFLGFSRASVEDQRLEDRVAQLERKVQYVVGPVVRAKVARSTVFLYQENTGGVREAIGVAFFYSARTAITCAHVLPDGTDVGDEVHAVRYDGDEMRVLRLKVASRDTGLDCATLTCETENEHVEILRMSTDELLNARLGVCSYPLRRYKDLRELDHGMFVTEGYVTGLTKHYRCFFYKSACSPGELGSAVVVHDGKVVGMHTEGVSGMLERVNREGDIVTNERLSALGMSISTAITSLDRGAIALSAACFPEPTV